MCHKLKYSAQKYTRQKLKCEKYEVGADDDDDDDGKDKGMEKRKI